MGFIDRIFKKPIEGDNEAEVVTFTEELKGRGGVVVFSGGLKDVSVRRVDHNGVVTVEHKIVAVRCKKK